MRERDPYAVLGLARGATPEEIKAVYRQLAFLMGLKDRRHQSPEELSGGLPVGARLPSFQYQVADGGRTRMESWHGGGHDGTLLLFGDPLCASCEGALVALENLAKSGRLGSIGCMVVTSESQEIVAAVDAFRDSILPIIHVEKEVIISAFNLKATPYLLLVDSAGTVAASGPAYDEKTIVHLLQHRIGQGPRVADAVEKTHA